MSADQSTIVPYAPYANASLYVGDLRLDVTESDLYDAFKECGTIQSVRICRDMRDQHSLRYGYVNFQSHENAQKALDTLNGKRIKGKPCRAMWCRRDPTERRSNEGNLFVKGLDKSVDLVRLQDCFSQFGPILSCKVATDDKGLSRGYAFVHFEKVEDAQKARDAAENDKDKLKSLGEGILVENFKSKQDRPNPPLQRYTNLYVKNLGAKFTSEDLQNLFAEFGEITSPMVMRDEKGASRLFGFVNFKNHDDAVKAREALDTKEFKWKEGVLVGPKAEGEDEEELKKEGIEVTKLYVARAQKREERERVIVNERNLREQSSPKTNLYIQRLADDVTDDDLRNLFKEFGVVKSVKVMRTPNGYSRGFGFCDFSTSEAASEAIHKVNNQLFHGKPLYVAYHQKRAERHQMLEMQNSNPRVMNMGGVYRQPQMFPGMYVPYMANMYPAQQYNMRQLYNRPSQFPRNYHNPRQTRRTKPVPQPVQPVVAPPAQQQPVPQQPVVAQPVAPHLAEADVNEKQQIGETIYTQIMKMFASEEGLWGKLTGMLLESIPIQELRELLKNPNLLQEKITQAKDYYDKHQFESSQAQ